MVELLLSEKIFPAVCALLGALIGMFGTIVVGYLNQKHETKRKLLEMAHASAVLEYDRDIQKKLRNRPPFCIYLYTNMLLMQRIDNISSSKEDAGSILAEIYKKKDICLEQMDQKIMEYFEMKEDMR